ncbi:MAG: hypothetical protein ABW127_09855 [Candidatus Thiodiazotropha endolucinida]
MSKRETPNLSSILLGNNVRIFDTFVQPDYSRKSSNVKLILDSLNEADKIHKGYLMADDQRKKKAAINKAHHDILHIKSNTYQQAIDSGEIQEDGDEYYSENLRKLIAEREGRLLNERIVSEYATWDGKNDEDTKSFNDYINNTKKEYLNEIGASKNFDYESFDRIITPTLSSLSMDHARKTNENVYKNNVELYEIELHDSLEAQVMTSRSPTDIADYINNKNGALQQKAIFNHDILTTNINVIANLYKETRDIDYINEIAGSVVFNGRPLTDAPDYKEAISSISTKIEQAEWEEYNRAYTREEREKKQHDSAALADAVEFFLDDPFADSHALIEKNHYSAKFASEVISLQKSIQNLSGAEDAQAVSRIWENIYNNPDFLVKDLGQHIGVVVNDSRTVRDMYRILRTKEKSKLEGELVLTGDKYGDDGLAVLQKMIKATNIIDTSVTATQYVKANNAMLLYIKSYKQYLADKEKEGIVPTDYQRLAFSRYLANKIASYMPEFTNEYISHEAFMADENTKNKNKKDIVAAMKKKKTHELRQKREREERERRKKEKKKSKYSLWD